MTLAKSGLNTKEILILLSFFIFSFSYCYYLNHLMDKSSINQFNEYLQVHHITNINTDNMHSEGAYLVNPERFIYCDDEHTYYEVTFADKHSFNDMYATELK